MIAGMSCDLRRVTVPLTVCLPYGLFADLQALLIHLAVAELATGRHTLH